MSDPIQSYLARRRRQQSGQAIVIVTFMVLILIAAVGLAVDGGIGYVNNQAAERAAAAGALAGVIFMPLQYTPAQAQPPGSRNDATDRAFDEAARNGYQHSPPSVIVTPTSVVGQSNQLRVTVRIRVQTFFMSLFGISQYYVQQTATAAYLPPIQLGQPGNQLGAAVSELGQPSRTFFLRSEGWNVDRGQGDAFSPNPAPGNGCTLACPTDDVHAISQQLGTELAYGGAYALPDRGGYNFRVQIPTGVHARIQVYNTSFAPDKNSANGNHCDNFNPAHPNYPLHCNPITAQTVNYYYHEDDGTFTYTNPQNYSQMSYSVFRMSNEYVRTSDQLLTQMRVHPIQAHNYNQPAPQYHEPILNQDITQTWDVNGFPTNMHIYHDWTDVMQYQETVPNMVGCSPGCGSWTNPSDLGHYLTQGVYRLRVDTLMADGSLPNGTDATLGGAHKGYAVRVTLQDGVTLCGSCSLGALSDISLFTPFHNDIDGRFNLPIFQLPQDYAGRTILVDIFDPGDINTNSGQLNLGITDPTVAGCVYGPPCLSQPQAPAQWQADQLGRCRISGCDGLTITDGPNSTPVTTFAANSGSHPYDNYWLQFEVPVPSGYAPDPLNPNLWWWDLQYHTQASVTAQDTITIAISLKGSPAHLLPPP